MLNIDLTALFLNVIVFTIVPKEVLGAPFGILTDLTDHYRAPSAKIKVTIRHRRSRYWDFWQLNSHVCPPSLCKNTDGSHKRKPMGTGGSVFYNGDIVLDMEQEKMIFNYSEVASQGSKVRRKRATVRRHDRLWRNGIMHYHFADDLPLKTKRVIRKAMKHISSETCIRFVRWNHTAEQYVRFIYEPGCWSNVGRVGGEQKISLGSGCDNVGTAIHEIAHALGFWHEHIRPDRDTYVQIRTENISPRYYDDFKMVPSSEITSRGYPYDYLSIMHYKERTFTNNGRKTIQVIGIGKQLKVKIGQRDGLSDIDIAQLRDMYGCNEKQDRSEASCLSGWIQFKTSCYKFVNKPRANFKKAEQACAETSSRLLVIDGRYEDAFVKKEINKTHPYVLRWRTAGIRKNDTLRWSMGNGEYQDMTYQQRGRYTNEQDSLVLFRKRGSTKIKWKGAGSSTKYAYICEREAKRPCLELAYWDGRDYRGNLSHTRDGVNCQNWRSNYPHKHNLFSPGNDDGLGNHNHCRNPEALRRNRPWCYTTKGNEEWQYCDVSVCIKTIKHEKPVTESPSISNNVKKGNLSISNTIDSRDRRNNEDIQEEMIEIETNRILN